MLEARLAQGSLLKKIIEAIKDLVQDANFDCSDSGISLQAMDSAHVALCALLLKADSFEPYRCDRNMSLGINLNAFSKMLKCSGNDDILTLKADDDTDLLTMMFENQAADRLSEYELKLMDIDAEHLGIPDQEFDCTVKMPSAEFARIVRDLATINESVTISVTKEGVRFAASGDHGKGSVLLKPSGSVDDAGSGSQTSIQLSEPVMVSLSLKYLNTFTKAAPLSETVTLQITNDVPVLIDFAVGEAGYIRYFLAPKINEDE
ncbi:hypothetical protein IWQ60_000376 [Tieghemiomyces parasiticus]|uniref:DNA sliding clamp PCNA n=1 Tax=Tieghemiomyces parasiticus TaxID=78921 RepID=A0A9W8DXH5_9FUNG|nr:hypothetical protein IWQ60_000520 [Tieghemiomyces parasiticus]KAJ1930355.1 hypothetical protein IWQ60_000376 [Tieghemiomyces parasiticus]